MAGVEFVDGQANGFEGQPFEGGSMQSGGPVEGPCSDYSRTADINISGDMPPQSGNPVQSPVDEY
jgi:hypothetical protein